MATRLEQLKAKQEQLQNRIKQELTKERTKERKQATRRKILLGSLLEAMMDKDETLRADIQRRLETFLTRAFDRQAFGLTGGTEAPGAETDATSEESQDDARPETAA